MEERERRRVGFFGLPLSSVLSPLLRRGERKKICASSENFHRSRESSTDSRLAPESGTWYWLHIEFENGWPSSLTFRMSYNFPGKLDQERVTAVFVPLG
jgi:hypothetical protein